MHTLRELETIARQKRMYAADKNIYGYISDQVKKLILSTDIEYVASNCIGKIGNPVMYQLNVIAENAKNYKINYNTHDVDDIYHSWFIINQLNHLAQEYPLICEIGSGYGLSLIHI